MTIEKQTAMIATASQPRFPKRPAYSTTSRPVA